MGIRRELRVKNKTDQILYVVYKKTNRRGLGWVEPADTARFAVNDPTGDSAFLLLATSEQSGDQWEAKDKGDYMEYVLTIEG